MEGASLSQGTSTGSMCSCIKRSKGPAVGASWCTESAETRGSPRAAERAASALAESSTRRVGSAFCLRYEAVAIRIGSEWQTGSGNEDRQTKTTAGDSGSLRPFWLPSLCPEAGLELPNRPMSASRLRTVLFNPMSRYEHISGRSCLG